MKIYTRTGDDGSTGLLGAGRVMKCAPRVEAYGEVDELNAMLGMARALDREGWVAGELGIVQSRLFQLGAELAATEPAALAHLEVVSSKDVAQLENWIDDLDRRLPPLKSFILPDGTPLAASLHLARTVCRRAERRVVALQRETTVAPPVVHYLNRLADLLFMQARWCNAQAGHAETEWHGREAHGGCGA